MYLINIMFIYLLCELIPKYDALQTPSIQNVILKPIGLTKSNVTVLLNSTRERCLCELLSSKKHYQAFNSFSNGSCQFFPSFPSSYRLSQFVGARFYFLPNISLSSKVCCVPNITELLIRLQNIIPNLINLPFQPSAFGYDDNVPHEAAVIGFSQGTIHWFDPFSFTLLRNASVWTSLSLALYRNLVFTSKDGTPAINVLDKQANQQIINITHGSLSQTRKYIFLNNGQTMIASGQSSNALVIFNNNGGTNYIFQRLISFPFPTVHGLAKWNDTFLYASTWIDRRISTCQYGNNAWNCQSFVNATGSGSGSHITVDECGRIWYVIGTFGLRIYDPSGVEIANWDMGLGEWDQIYDILLLPNYILIISFVNTQKIVQYNPQLLCS